MAKKRRRVKKKRRIKIPLPEKGEPGWVRRIYEVMEQRLRWTMEMTDVYPSDPITQEMADRLAIPLDTLETMRLVLLRRHRMQEIAPGLWMPRTTLEARVRKIEGVANPWRREVIDRISGWVKFNLHRREPWVDASGTVRIDPPKAGEPGFREHLKEGLRWVMESGLRVKNGRQFGVRDVPIKPAEARSAGLPRAELEEIRLEVIREWDLVEIRPGYLGNREYVR